MGKKIHTDDLTLVYLAWKRYTWTSDSVAKYPWDAKYVFKIIQYILKKIPIDELYKEMCHYEPRDIVYYQCRDYYDDNDDNEYDEESDDECIDPAEEKAKQFDDAEKIDWNEFWRVIDSCNRYIDTSELVKEFWQCHKRLNKLITQIKEALCIIAKVNNADEIIIHPSTPIQRYLSIHSPITIYTRDLGCSAVSLLPKPAMIRIYKTWLDNLVMLKMLYLIPY